MTEDEDKMAIALNMRLGEVFVQLRDIAENIPEKKKIVSFEFADVNFRIVCELKNDGAENAE